MSNVHVVQHPLLECHLTEMRCRETPCERFRALLQRVATLLVVEATRDLVVRPRTVETPLARFCGAEVAERVGIVPILRAGLGMADAALEIIPGAEVWHMGLYRDEATAQPVEYYSKLPPGAPVATALILDPMLATGGSALLTIEAVRAWGVPKIKLVSVIASQPGLDRIAQSAPDVQIYVSAVDPKLNAQKYIVPGLGDAGDRTFHTRGSESIDGEPN